MSQDAKNPLAGVSEEREKLEQWLAIRKESGLQIDPLTAEVCWEYGQTLDPYGIDPPPAEYDQLQGTTSRGLLEVTYGSISTISRTRPVMRCGIGIDQNWVFLQDWRKSSPQEKTTRTINAGADQCLSRMKSGV